MTIKWVKSDPLVMNGEPFCYGSRLTVRQLLQLRESGYGLTEILKDHPELRVVYVHTTDYPMHTWPPEAPESKEHLAGFKVPAWIEFRTELPKTLVGKVLRRALREGG